MKASYYHDGSGLLPDELTIPVEHLSPKAGAASLIATNAMFECLRTVGAAPSPEFRDVYDFHRRFDLMAAVVPRHLTRRKLKERAEFLLEELKEFCGAAGLSIMPDRGDGLPIVVDYGGDQDLAQQADALVDLVYVALGTAVMLGLPWDVLWADVQRANLAKVRGTTKRGHTVDVTKPEGWVGPRTGAILAAAGYDPDDYLIGNGSGLIDEAKCHDDV